MTTSNHRVFFRGIVRNNSFWDMLVFKKVQEGLGGRLRLMLVGSAPLAENVLTFTRCALGCLVRPLKSAHLQNSNPQLYSGCGGLWSDGMLRPHHSYRPGRPHTGPRGPSSGVLLCQAGGCTRDGVLGQEQSGGDLRKGN